MFCGSSWLVYRLVREDDPEGFVEWIEAGIYGFIATFIAAMIVRWV
jgi:hypothetical protein